MKILMWTAAIWFATCGALQARTVGFEALSIPVAGDPPLKVGVWYPADAPESEQRLALSRQSVAPGAPVVGRGLPLVVISHGTGGSFADHYDTAHALAEAGFVVVAVSHTGDTYDDHSRAARAADRAPQLSRAIDYMTTAWPAHGQLDPGRIGVFGFSAGGFTALMAIGGEPDLTTVPAMCARRPGAFECGVLRGSGAAAPLEAHPRAHDPRIRAAVIAAPALGYAFAPDGLAKVSVPVQLWRGEADTILPNPFYAEAVRGALPTAPDYRVVPGANHFDFLPPCSAELAKVAPPICAGTFDRAAFHARFNADVVAFFRMTLK